MTRSLASWDLALAWASDSLCFDEGYRVIETEGGHINFAPLDSLEDQLLMMLRKRHRRVSIERVVSGTGLANIYEALAAIEDRCIDYRDEKKHCGPPR